jgi:branched-chain amino acid transport system permease protein
MTAAAVPESGMPDVSAKGALDIDVRKVVTYGFYGAGGMIFIALSGMLVGLDPRAIIEGRLSLGYLAVLWLPILIGYLVANEVVLEGMVASARGARDLVAGALAGLLTGAGLSLLVVLVDNFDLRDPLVNWSPQLLAQLDFDRSNGFGIMAWLGIGLVLGIVGASFHLMPVAARRVLRLVTVTVLMFAVFQPIVVDFFGEIALDSITDFIYASRGGLTVSSAVVLAIVAAAAAVVGKGRVGEARERLDQLDGPARTRANTTIFIVGLLALVVFTWFAGKITQELLANVGLFLLLALGLNIVVGLAGILDLGYVAFFAVGGYTTAVLTSPNSPGWAPEYPWVVALVVTVVMAAMAGLFIGAPVIRMRGDYLAIVTLGFGEIIRLLLLSDWLSGFFGGAQGITNIPAADFGPVEVKGTDPRSVFYLVLVFCLIAIYASWRLERSRLGRAWMAVREDESVAEAMGINTVNVKLMAFVVGAVLASFSGAVFSAKVGSIFPTSFLILVSIIILVVVIVGGMGNIAGVIAGAVVLIGVLGGPKQPGLLQEFSEYKLLIYGALLVLMMLKRPEGLIPNVRRTRELHQEEFLQDAWLKGAVDDAHPDDDPGGTPATGTVAPA